jgi:predicted nucleic acid-binding protein
MDPRIIALAKSIEAEIATNDRKHKEAIANECWHFASHYQTVADTLSTILHDLNRIIQD